jgi:hypothetical protein
MTVPSRSVERTSAWPSVRLGPLLAIAAGAVLAVLAPLPSCAPVSMARGSGPGSSEAGCDPDPGPSDRPLRHADPGIEAVRAGYR